MAGTSNGTKASVQPIRSPSEQAETETTRAMEGLVAKPSFGRLLTVTAENTAALTRIGYDIADLVLRNLRLAGRADITSLARQLRRTEDKLERVLQEVESLRDQLPSESGATSADRDLVKRR